MKDELLFWIWLSTISGVGPVLIHNMLSYFGSPEFIYKATTSELTNVPGIRESKISAIESSRDLKNAQTILEQCIASNISVVCRDDSAYPKRLLALPDMPVVIYYKGTLIEPVKTAGIVGPRLCSKAARDKSIEIAEDLSSKGFSIISGMAKGIDSYSHTAAIKKDAFTIAVLGCGADICYPAIHKNLYDEIIKSGVVISEYPPHTKPRKFYFPQRNRIIAGLSDSVYVIGADDNSGSLITAEYARRYGKEVNFISC